MKERAARIVAEWRQARGRTDGGIMEVAEQLGVHMESVRTLGEEWTRTGGQETATRRGSPLWYLGAPSALDAAGHEGEMPVVDTPVAGARSRGRRKAPIAVIEKSRAG